MTHIRSHLLAAFAVAGFFISAPAFAQSSACQEGQKILQERQGLVQQINKLTAGGKKKQIDPRAACSVFTKLVTNGNAGQKWMTENKDWCQIPDQVVEGFSKDHKQSESIKGQACQAAAKMAEMEKRAKQQAQQAQQGGGMGSKMGGGLTGTLSIPKGAL
jgi:adenine-specific DNA methylase